MNSVLEIGELFREIERRSLAQSHHRGVQRSELKRAAAVSVIHVLGHRMHAAAGAAYHIEWRDLLIHLFKRPSIRFKRMWSERQPHRFRHAIGRLAERRERKLHHRFIIWQHKLEVHDSRPCDTTLAFAGWIVNLELRQDPRGTLGSAAPTTHQRRMPVARFCSESPHVRLAEVSRSPPFLAPHISRQIVVVVRR